MKKFKNWIYTRNFRKIKVEENWFFDTPENTENELGPFCLSAGTDI